MTTITLKTDKPKAPDSVIAEVRRAKTVLSERFNYDLSAMLRDARLRQATSGHKVITKSTDA